MLSTFEKILILRNVSFFRDICSEDLRLIAEICDEVAFSAGDILMKENEEGRELYIIEKGKVRVYHDDQTIDLVPPTYVGEMAILAGGARRATVEALEDTNTLMIESGKFRQVILKYPRIIFPIVRSIVERLE
ncbi:MAG: cyclic nucleotide-binding domain-containing protein [Candidatus Hydrogenedentota bacterium]|nr:MAG: cyclic nucleotide-binding domain-containing protein [Candidatus Hydrogenedentota bacterium]